ncbi:hypothetical protein POX_a00017 [Penicillium oxalicum]|uniref:Uncharacterized protein n=1 Tax=Penicillium oxalicum (strain 114-2 / CGMCC 5302) TaxID=933388 RepID=S8B7P7_PENO1|nr:hypothetical protein POX_a00017 [Penicillium oxalicum]EPS35018.1 hypothetical protein PDE_09983 [Penicillium oxalicum 114-2]KAI2793438.1 hypothetical protein POX_a00017 [Penicillium oxalicum]
MPVRNGKLLVQDPGCAMLAKGGRKCRATFRGGVQGTVDPPKDPPD